MGRRLFLKFGSLAAIGAALMPKAFAMPQSTIAPADLSVMDFAALPVPNDRIPTLGNLSKILHHDDIPLGYLPNYETDLRAQPFVYDARIGSGIAMIATQEEGERYGSIRLPLSRFKNVKEEDRAMINLLDKTVNSAHTVTGVGGLHLTGLHHTMLCIEQHDVSIAFLIMHPEMLVQFKPIWGEEKFKEIFQPILDGKGEGGFIWNVKNHRYEVSFGNGQKRWEEEKAVTREISILLSDEMPKDLIYCSGRPDYVGVHASMEDGTTGLAILNDYAVSKLNVVKEGADFEYFEKLRRDEARKHEPV